MGYFLLENNQKDITYGIIYGIYNEDEFKKETINLSNYIYKINNNKYIVYIGFTRNKKNLEKLKNFYLKKGYNISIENIKIDDKLKKIIDSCDILLEKTINDEEIEKIENKILEIEVI